MSVSFVDPERPSLYNYICYTSKLIKVRSELHKKQEEEYPFHKPIEFNTRPIISKQNDLGLKSVFQQEKTPPGCFSLQTKVKQDFDNLDRNICYLSTLKKLNGLEITKKQNRTAILISLSPNVLSAANVARQRRKLSH